MKTKSAIIKNLPNSEAYGVQIRGGKFYRWTTSKKEAARMAAIEASDGFPTLVKHDSGELICR